MKCKIEFQYRAKKDSRPQDYVQEVAIDPALPLPCIGDHVACDEQGWEGNYVVENRLFSYVRTSGEPWLVVNIVVTDSDTPEGLLVKM